MDDLLACLSAHEFTETTAEGYQAVDRLVLFCQLWRTIELLLILHIFGNYRLCFDSVKTINNYGLLRGRVYIISSTQRAVIVLLYRTNIPFHSNWPVGKKRTSIISRSYSAALLIWTNISDLTVHHVIFYLPID